MLNKAYEGSYRIGVRTMRQRLRLDVIAIGIFIDTFVGYLYRRQL